MTVGLRGSALHIDVPLTNLVIDYVPDEYIVQDIFPIIPVQKETDKYFIWNQGDGMRIHDDIVGRDMRVKLIERGLSNDNYVCQPRGLGTRIYDLDMELADAVLDLKRADAELLMSSIFRGWESRAATTLQSTSSVGCSQTLTGATQFSAVNSGDPIGTILTGIETIEAAGITPDSIIIPKKVLRRIAQNNRFQAKTMYTKALFPGMERELVNVIGDATGLKNVYVPGLLKNTANEGADAVFGEIWSDNIHIFKKGTPGPRGNTAGYAYTFRLTGGVYAGRTLAVSSYRLAEENGKGIQLEVHLAQDEKVVGKAFSHTIFDCLA